MWTTAVPVSTGTSRLHLTDLRIIAQKVICGCIIPQDAEDHNPDGLGNKVYCS